MTCRAGGIDDQRLVMEVGRRGGLHAGRVADTFGMILGETRTGSTPNLDKCLEIRRLYTQGGDPVQEALTDKGQPGAGIAEDEGNPTVVLPRIHRHNDGTKRECGKRLDHGVGVIVGHGGDAVTGPHTCSEEVVGGLSHFLVKLRVRQLLPPSVFAVKNQERLLIVPVRLQIQQLADTAVRHHGFGGRDPSDGLCLEDLLLQICCTGAHGAFFIQLFQYSLHSTASPAGRTCMGLSPSSITAYSSVCVLFPWAASALGCGP